MCLKTFFETSSNTCFGFLEWDENVLLPHSTITANSSCLRLCCSDTPTSSPLASASSDAHSMQFVMDVLSLSFAESRVG